MKLPFSLPFGKKQKTEYFLALLLRDEKVTAVIFQEQHGVVKAVSDQEVEFISSIESSSAEEWIDAIDKAVSSAEQHLPKGIETRKTVFGVKSDWVEDAKIKKEYLVKLKKVSDTLGFVPIGFLVLAEAIVHLMSREEGAPVSALLVEVGMKNLTVSLVRAGQVLQTKTAAIEDSVVATVDKLLHQFTGFDVLPSRIIFFNTKEDEALSQEFISHTWSRSIPFLHVPQVIPLPGGFDAKAILFGAAVQMGFEVLGDGAQGTEETQNAEEGTSSVASGRANEELLDAAAVGFHEESSDGTKGTEEAKVEEEKEELVIHDRLGTPEDAIMEEEERMSHEDIPRKGRQGMPFAMIGGLLAPAVRGFKKATSSFSRMPGFGKLIFIPPLLLLLVIGIFALYLFGLKATVTLAVDPKVVTKSQDITFTTGEPTDFASNRINAGALSVSLDGKASTAATGTKEIGEKAKGSVTLYSRLAQSKTFAQGTALKGPNDLVFTLDKAVTLASSSADASSTPSTATVGVTAKEIGKEANLPSGSKFSVDTYEQADVVAKNESAFSGGSKKEVTVVARTDVDKLTEELPKTLEDKAKDESNTKVASGEEALPSFVSVSLDKKTFDKQVGEEAKTVTLTATVTYQKLSFKKQTMEDYAKKLLEDDLKNMTVLDNGLTYELTDIKQDKKKELTAKVAAKASLLPTVNQGELASQVAAKSFDEARGILKGVSQVKDVTIRLVPSLPFLPELLPRKTSNISIVLSNE